MNQKEKPVGEPCPPQSKTRDPRWVVFIQYLLPISFTVSMLGIIAWIASLILLSKRLHDVPSASIGISIVTIPIFLILLGVFWYVFLGVIRNQEESPSPPVKGEVGSTKSEVRSAKKK